MAGLLFGNLVAAPQRQRRARTYRENDNWLFSPTKNFVPVRFGREYIEYILNVIGKDLRRKTRRNHAMSPSKQLLVALRFFASGSFLQVVGDIEGVDKSSASRAVQHVSQLLAAKQEMFIKWPTTAAEVNANKNGFYRKRRFPGVIGCVDGTHSRIIAPHDNEADYVNRKGFHSINVQALCNHEGR